MMDEEEQKKIMDFLVSQEATLKDVSLQSGVMRSAWEKFGTAGVASYVGGRKGGSATREDFVEDWENYQVVRDKMETNHPDWGKMKVARETARICGVSEKTIRDRTKSRKGK